MKVYARDAIRQYGVANYVLSEDRFKQDDQTGEVFIVREKMVETNEQLTDRLARTTFSHSSKFYPVKRPCAPASSPRPVIVNYNPSFKCLPKKSVDEITNRLSKTTFNAKLKKKESTPEPGMHRCPVQKRRQVKFDKKKAKAGTPRPGTVTPRGTPMNTPRGSPSVR